MNSTEISTTPLPRSGMTWAFLVVAGIVSVGSITLLYLAGLSTFDTGLYWEDHVFLGRIMSTFALILPILALIARLGRSFIIPSVILAVLYMAQNMFTFIDIGPVAALHALNSFPLILLSAFAAVRAYQLLQNRRDNDAG